MKDRIAVVVCHYNARSDESLIKLLDQIREVPAGCEFQVRVVVNLGVPKRLLLPHRHRDIQILYRENTGYNIGAWDYGWRQSPIFSGYLFLQEECRLVRPDWGVGFVRRAAEPGIGLVGECLSPDWDASWDELARRTAHDRFREQLVNGQPAERVPCYLDFFRRKGIDPGRGGDHLQSLILFTRRETLEAIDGFPIGENFGEAVAAEIGISKKVQALGLAICQVGPVPFFFIEHEQWLHRRPLPLPPEHG